MSNKQGTVKEASNLLLNIVLTQHVFSPKENEASFGTSAVFNGESVPSAISDNRGCCCVGALTIASQAAFLRVKLIRPRFAFQFAGST